MAAPPQHPVRRKRTGTLLVAGLLITGVALAEVARRYRVPGSAPRLRMLPSNEDLEPGGPGWTLPPGKEIAARAVVRLRIVDERTDTLIAGAVLEGPAGEKSRALEDGSLLLELGRPAPSSRAEATIRVARPTGEFWNLTAPLRVSNREDALDVPVFRVTLP
jgi:hypothetical protein